MAINSMQRPPLRHIASFVSSGTMLIPEGITKVYVSVEGATGVSYHSAAPAGQTHRSRGYVEVIPGKSALVTVGAASTTNGARAGTTSFDGAITITGGSSGYADPIGPRYSGGGGAGAVTVTSSLPTGAPGDATVRVTSSTFATFYPGQSLSGVVHVFG
jgi:hypothetical protein